MTPVDNTVDAKDGAKDGRNDGMNDDAMRTKENSSRVPTWVPIWVRRWCYCCRNCTGIIILLGIVNGITVASLWLMGSLLGTILGHSGSDVIYEYRGLDIAMVTVAQFCTLAMDLLTLNWLCKRYNSSGRDYKAFLHVFCCCRKTNRRVYPETIRPVRDVMSDICSNGACIRWICRCCIVTSLAILFAISVEYFSFGIYTSGQNTMLLWLGLISLFLWVLVVVVWRTKGGMKQHQQQLEEQEEQNSEENTERSQTQVSEIEIV